MKTLGKWLIILCCVAWAAKNPAVVSGDIHQLMSAGVSVVGSLANAAGSAVSGVTNGVSGGSTPSAPEPAPVPAVPSPAATPGH